MVIMETKIAMVTTITLITSHRKKHDVYCEHSNCVWHNEGFMFFFVNANKGESMDQRGRHEMSKLSDQETRVRLYVR